MTPARSDDYLRGLVGELCRTPHESEWVEFKENNKSPEDIGEYIAALSNSAALVSRPFAYLVWGIRDSDHAVTGTSFKPLSEKHGNENLANWLTRLVQPRTWFQFYEVRVSSKDVVVLEIEAASTTPIRFGNDEWIRVGSYKKKLRDHTELAKELWRALQKITFDRSISLDGAGDEDVVALLDYPSYFELMGAPLPENRAGILSSLQADNIIVRADDGTWSVTNLGAILFARRLSDFPSTARKSLRVVQYRGTSRVETLREQEGVRGYAAGFKGMIEYIKNLLPANEVIGQALRKMVPMYPDLAIRELVANALIHQDFAQTGTGPMVELFEGRVEITNPGTPLVAPERFIDAPPRSRNEALASMMRRIGVCEERGSGWDKIGFEIEFHQLPAPLIELPEASTRVVLFSPRPLQQMGKEERVRAVYMHSCLRYVTREQMTNSSVRERFGISTQNSAQASRLIGEAVEAGVVVPYDAQAAKKLMRYLPAWAAEGSQGRP